MRTRHTGPVTPPGARAAAGPAETKAKPGKTKPAKTSTETRTSNSAAAASSAKKKKGRNDSESVPSKGKSKVDVTSEDGSKNKQQPSSYYRQIHGVKYDRKVLDDCEASVNDDGVIDLNEATRIVADVLDGPKKKQARGAVSSVTDVELATLRYAHAHFAWSKEADAWVYGELINRFEQGETGGEGPEVDEMEHGSSDEDEGDGATATRSDSGEDSPNDEDEEEDSDDDSSSASEDASDAEEDAEPKWDALDEYNAFFFARCVELAAAKSAVLKRDTAGTLFPTPEGRTSFLKREKKAAARFTAVDMFAAGGLATERASSYYSTKKLVGGVKSSSVGTAQDSLFGGHVLGGDLVDVVPVFSKQRGATIDQMPDNKVGASRKKPKQIADERLAKRRGKDGGAKTDAKKADALRAANNLAKDGAGLFIKPLDTSKLQREAKKLGANQSTGRSWFAMPAVEYTPELRRDMRLLKLRGAYDPKRFYKTDDTSKLPKHFQVGTVIEGAQDFYSARLTKKERKRTLTEEVFADAEIKKLRNKRFAKIQANKAHTMGRSEKRKLGGRSRNAAGGGKPNAQKSTKRVKR